MQDVLDVSVLVVTLASQETALILTEWRCDKQNKLKDFHFVTAVWCQLTEARAVAVSGAAAGTCVHAKDRKFYHRYCDEYTI